jgi:ABC-type antimicrobial peptide transport system permease subunit
VIFFGICFGTLIARLGQASRAPVSMGIEAAFFAFSGGTLGALENLMSCWLMQFETVIPQMLTYNNSSFAAHKFISFTIAIALVIAAIVTGLISGGMRMIRPTRMA